MPKKNGRRKKTRTHVVERAGAEDENTPMSFVFKMGKAPSVITELVSDMRRAMLPFTADKLKEKRKNTLKDFIAVGAPLGVTHFIFFTHTEAGTNLKIARIPRGPTLTFKVTAYSLMSQVHLVHRRPVDFSSAFSTKPLVVLNNFTGTEDHIKLMNVTFQNMFPPIDVQTVKLAECRRVVLFNYEKDTDTVEFRQYVVRANPLGLTKSVKNIVRAKIPNLAKLDDISEYVLGRGATGAGTDGGVTSDSEAEDESTHVTLPDSFRGRGNQKSEKSAVRLTEVGPRLTLKLTKVEREICEGDVLYHAYITKSPEEAAKDKAKREMAQALKRKRREEQEANVSKKNDARDAKRQRKLERKKAQDDDLLDDGYKPTNAGDESEVDDAEYYRQEVGEEPDAFMFEKKDKKKEQAKKAHIASKPQQKFNEMAPSDKAAMFRFRKNQEDAAKNRPKGTVVRSRPQGAAGGGRGSGGRGSGVRGGGRGGGRGGRGGRGGKRK